MFKNLKILPKSGADISPLTQTPPQPVIIQHEQLTKQIPVPDRISTANRAASAKTPIQPNFSYKV